MAVCYLETFLLQNAVVDAGLLWLAAAWRGGRVRPLRILMGSSAGALLALLAAMAGGLARSVPAQGLISLAMILLGLGRAPALSTAKSAGALWGGALLLGGAVAMGMSMMLAGAATGFAGIALLRRKNAPPPPSVQLTILLGDTLRVFEAIVDTGNRALDPTTCLPVVVIPPGLFMPEGGRVVAIRTAAGLSLLPCFVPDMLTIDGEEQRAVVAIAGEGRLEAPLVPYVLCRGRRTLCAS